MPAAVNIRMNTGSIYLEFVVLIQNRIRNNFILLWINEIHYNHPCHTNIVHVSFIVLSRISTRTSFFLYFHNNNITILIARTRRISSSPLPRPFLSSSSFYPLILLPEFFYLKSVPKILEFLFEICYTNTSNSLATFIQKREKKKKTRSKRYYTQVAFYICNLLDN